MALDGTTSLGLISKLGAAPVAFGAPAVADLAMRLGLMVVAVASGLSVTVVSDWVLFKMDFGLFDID